MNEVVGSGLACGKRRPGGARSSLFLEKVESWDFYRKFPTLLNSEREGVEKETSGRGCSKNLRVR